MIIVDFNGVVVGQILQMKDQVTEDLVRHTILNTLRMYSHKYKNEYGELTICCDSRSWRKGYFPEYKANRKKTKDANKEQFENMYKIMDKVLEEIKENLPYKVVRVQGAEADDIIAVMIKETQEFNQFDDVMLISGDKDFVQLHKYGNVKQYSPITKKFITDDNSERTLFDHILKGDLSDGVPNILSPDDIFITEGVRQTPLSKKKIDAFWESKDDLKSAMSEDQYRNYVRNKMMISLDEIPAKVEEDILDALKVEKKNPGKMKLMNYLIANRCKLLVECIDEF